MRLSEDLCLQAQTLIASRLGLDFSKGRQADLERGLVQACQTSSVSAPETYLARLATLPDESAEWRRLAGYLTVGETYFFRDCALFEALEQHVLPSLITACRTERNLRLRFWSAGCATGEEPYSLAILLDRLLPDLSDWALRSWPPTSTLTPWRRPVEGATGNGPSGRLPSGSGIGTSTAGAQRPSR